MVQELYGALAGHRGRGYSRRGPLNPVRSVAVIGARNGTARCNQQGKWQRGSSDRENVDDLVGRRIDDDDPFVSKSDIFVITVLRNDLDHARWEPVKPNGLGTAVPTEMLNIGRTGSTLFSIMTFRISVRCPVVTLTFTCEPAFCSFVAADGGGPETSPLVAPAVPVFPSWFWKNQVSVFFVVRLSALPNGI